MIAQQPRALVIDDQPLVCSLVARALRSRCAVDVAMSGREALERIRSGVDYDLVLTDMIMPDATAFDVLELLRHERPTLASRLMLMTGRTPTAQDEQQLAAAGIPVLAKPFNKTELLLAVRPYFDRAK